MRILSWVSSRTMFRVDDEDDDIFVNRYFFALYLLFSNS